MTHEIDRHAVLAALTRHVGAANGISANALSIEMAGVYATAGTERALRRVVEQLRGDGHHICARPETGYFMAASADELLETLEFLHARAMSSLRQIAAMQRVSLPDLRSQLRLPLNTKVAA